MNPQPHQELLTRANKVRAAATDRDSDRLRREVQALLDAFRGHVDGMAASIAALPRATATALGQGQRQVLERLVVLAAAAGQDEVAPACGTLGRELATLLSIQAETERRAMAQHASSHTGVDLPSDRARRHVQMLV